MFDDAALNEQYATLAAYSDPIKAAERTIVGREYELSQLMAAMERPELCNALLIAPAGSGKTALVQELMREDTRRKYLEIDLSRMIADLRNLEEMASRIKTLFDDAERYAAQEGHGLVLFMDEFHQLVQLSSAAVEGIKPVLAASGARGLRIIAATTNEEFHEHISKNQPLVERLQRISLSPPDRKTTVSILRGMAARYEVADQFHDDHLFELIYEYTERYVPESSQPRKSILVLDAMVGWQRHTSRPMSKELLADVLKESREVNVAFRVDAVKIQEQLDRKVLNQELATGVVARRLQLCVADLQDKTKPMSSMLFTGSTGVGKACADSTRVPVFEADGKVAWKLHGDLVPGDKVFQRDGSVQDVLGVFPQGEQDIYRVTLWDGRILDVVGSHLWGVYTAKMRSNMHAGKQVQPRTMTTLEMIEKGVVRTYPGDTREHMKFFIPANGAVQWPEQSLEIDPYTVGAFIGNGCLTASQLTLSSDDAAMVLRIGESIGSTPKKAAAYNYDWLFPTGEKWGTRDRLIQTADFFASTPSLIDCYSADRRIPEQYMTASVEQRWELVRGLFDTDGTIDGSTGRFNVSYSTFSKGLAEDIRSLLFSLGVSNTLNTWTRTKDDGRVLVEYDVHVKVGNEDKEQFFWLPRKRQIASAAAEATSGRQRVKKFDMVGIKSIEKLPEQQSASCIYVSGEEHLYQAGEFIVTHNTELTKQLSRLLFGDDQRHLIRFDMSEYALDESMDRFREELTMRVWNTQHAVILLDEVEKAASTVTRLLLQVLDDGRLSNRHGRETSFLNSYIILTTNAASEIYSRMSSYIEEGASVEDTMKRYMKLIRSSIVETTGDNRFPPELLNRIDVIAPFQPLGLDVQRKIVLVKLQEMAREVKAKHGVTIAVDKKVVQYLVDDLSDTSTDSGGARGIVAKLTDEVTTSIAAYINAHPYEKSLRVEIEGDLVSDHKDMLESDARVRVTSAV